MKSATFNVNGSFQRKMSSNSGCLGMLKCKICICI